MEDKSESSGSFWSSLPGILTAIGGLLVASTGLISVLVTTGVIGQKDNSNAERQTNAQVTTPSAPLTNSSANPDDGRYKELIGKWEVIEKPSHYFDKVKSVTWLYDAAVSGSELTLTGKISAIDGDKNLDENEERIRSTYVTTLVGRAGVGEYRLQKPDGSTVIFPANIRLGDDLRRLVGSFEVESLPTIRLAGRKLQ